MPPKLLSCILLTLAALTSTSCVHGEEGTRVRTNLEHFSSRVHIRPRNARLIDADFEFKLRVDDDIRLRRHTTLFPKPVAQLLQRADVERLDVSLASSPQKDQPVGGIVAASFNTHSDNDIDTRWLQVRSDLGSLLCASLSDVIEVDRVDRSVDQIVGNRRDLIDVHAAAPRERVCLENLAPFLRLLPCRERGLAALLAGDQRGDGFLSRARHVSLALRWVTDDYVARGVGEAHGSTLTLLVRLVLRQSTPTATLTSLSEVFSADHITDGVIACPLESATVTTDGFARVVGDINETVTDLQDRQTEWRLTQLPLQLRLLMPVAADTFESERQELRVTRRLVHGQDMFDGTMHVRVLPLDREQVVTLKIPLPRFVRFFRHSLHVNVPVEKRQWRPGQLLLVLRVSASTTALVALDYQHNLLPWQVALGKWWGKGIFE
ncbi:MAG: hypothetical protein MHM6MM_001961 [Cercozoa sp. M6MM]